MKSSKNIVIALSIIQLVLCGCSGKLKFGVTSLDTAKPISPGLSNDSGSNAGGSSGQGSIPTPQMPREPFLKEDSIAIDFAKTVPLASDGDTLLIVSKSEVACLTDDLDCVIKRDLYGESLHVKAVHEESGEVAETALIRPVSGHYIVQADVSGKNIVVLTGSRDSSLGMYPYAGEMTFKSLELYVQDDLGHWNYSSSFDLSKTCSSYCGESIGADFHFANGAKILSLKEGRVLLARQRYQAMQDYGWYEISDNALEIYSVDGNNLTFRGSVKIPNSAGSTWGRPDTVMAIQQGDSTFSVLTEGTDTHRGQIQIYAFSETSAATSAAMASGTSTTSPARRIQGIADGCMDPGVRDQAQHIAYSGDRLYIVTGSGIAAYETSAGGVSLSNVISDYRKNQEAPAPLRPCDTALQVRKGLLNILSLTDFYVYQNQSRFPEWGLYAVGSGSQKEKFMAAVALGPQEDLSPGFMTFEVLGSSLVLAANEVLYRKPHQTRVYPFFGQ